jgi:hypothetical protein
MNMSLRIGGISAAVAALVLSSGVADAQYRQATNWSQWRYESETGSTRVERERFNPDGAEETLQFPVTSKVYRVRYRQELRSVLVNDVNCTQDFYYSNNWNGYFTSYSADQKARILAGLVQGIGAARARRLVAANAFPGPSAPASWDAFTRIIGYQDNEIRGLYHDVVIQFGEVNRRALGYTNCTYTGTTHYEDRWVEVRDAHFDRDEVKQFRVIVSGGALLKGEKETFTGTYDWDGNRTNLGEPTYYNSYRGADVARDDGYAVTYRLYGTRKRVQPPNGLYLNPWNENGELVFQVRNDYWDAAAANNPAWGNAKVKVKLIQQNNNRRDNTLQEREYDLVRNQNLSPKQPTGVRPGPSQDGLIRPRNVDGKVKVEYQLRFYGSQYYSDTPSPGKDSHSVIFPINR